MNVFLDEFPNNLDRYIEDVTLSKGHLLIIGDFNNQTDVTDDPDASMFLDIIDSFGLHQHVNMTTHIHGYTLDLVITRKTSTII